MSEAVSSLGPLVSIVMPAYNAERFIAEAIASVLGQSHPHWELLVVDDGSKDGTRAVVQRFQEPRIRYLHQENRGVSAARNRGLEESRGEYFCFLDSDDALPPKSLAARLEVFARHPETAFVDGTVLVMDSHLSRVQRTYRPLFRGDAYPKLLSLEGQCFFGPSWMIRRKPGVRYQLKQGMTHGEDLLFYMGLARDGLYDFTDEVILHYRSHSSSAMTNLVGLERGYRTLYREMRDSLGVDLLRLAKARTRIGRVMFLSYLSQRDYRNALGFLARFAMPWR